jgi:glycerol-3-phosphate O-acyltransferase
MRSNLLVAHAGVRVMIDGGPGAERVRARQSPHSARAIVHTDHRASGYRIEIGHTVVSWAPELFVLPSWAADADLMFAEASPGTGPFDSRAARVATLQRMVQAERCAGTGVAPDLTMNNSSRRHGVSPPAELPPDRASSEDHHRLDRWFDALVTRAQGGDPRSATAAPPYVLSEEDVAEEVVSGVMTRVLAGPEVVGARRLEEIAYETLHAEESRLAREGTTSSLPPGLDPAFISRLRRALAYADRDDHAEIVRAIVIHYVHEIAGHFDRRVYRVATRVVPPAVSALLHGARGRGHLFDVDDRILIEGEVDALRALIQRGTVIIVPTHVSNLDSLVMGSVIHRLGLPPFAYGAGINLFTGPLIGFFMRHLGAYTIDRKKEDPLYRATLKEYATVLLSRGQHTLLFPGGTRSRSGRIEAKLKLGLLGTAPVAFRRALAAGAARPPIFIVPCTLTYPLVLEAATLVADYLRSEGGPQDHEARDEFDMPRRWFDFLRGLRRLDERVHARFSRPLDWLGNQVDDDGTPRDDRGCPVDPRDDLLAGGELAADDARDAASSRVLARRVLEAYRRDNVALPTSALAFVVFARLRAAWPEPDQFRFVRHLRPGDGVPVGEALRDLDRVMGELARLAHSGAVRLGRDLAGAPSRQVLDQALATFATYHRSRVVERQGERLFVGDPALLFYYRNRLDGYDLTEERPS